MACALTAGYTLDCRDSAGGVKVIHIIEKANVSAVTLTSSVVTGITKASGKAFYKYELVAFTAEGEDGLSVSVENGTMMTKQSVKFPINKMTAAVRNQLMLLGQNVLMIVVTDNNGTGWLYGHEFGMNMTAAAGKTGKTLADRNGFELEFTGEEKALAYPLDSTTLAALTTAGT